MLLSNQVSGNDEIVGSMRSWKHSGFSVDNSVKIEKGDHAGMQRLIEYISRCPFSLARMISRTPDGDILFRASHAKCIPFPLSGDKTLMKGVPRNFEMFDPLDFLAEVTQHIPNKGEHQIRYYGFYSNKKRGLQELFVCQNVYFDKYMISVGGGKHGKAGLILSTGQGLFQGFRCAPENRENCHQEKYKFRELLSAG